MPSNDIKIVKGLNIAIIVLAGLSVLCNLALVALLAFGGNALSDPALYSDIIYALEGDMGYGYHHDDMMGINMVSSIIGITIGLVVVLVAWCLICSILSLIAGILGLRNATKPDKLNSAFVWAIVGAVAAFLSASMITMALLIVSAVFIGKLRKQATPAYTYVAPAYGQAAPAYPQAETAYDQAAPAYPQSAPAYPQTVPTDEPHQPMPSQPVSDQPEQDGSAGSKGL